MDPLRDGLLIHCFVTTQSLLDSIVQKGQHEASIDMVVKFFVPRTQW